MSNATEQQAGTTNEATGWLVAELHRIRQVLDVLPLPDETTTVAHRELGVAEIALLEADPDRERIAGSLERLTLALAGSGALDHAGQALAGPLGHLADWLGEPAQPIRRLLA
ncbi:hypothetical protein [Actinoplanes subglobosus]|uniref:Uncharacterized protein n=1 Tax=Actinoplanes subglobosus TaxID=1547892 RepID=A0ABV8IZL0_9ACTN